MLFWADWNSLIVKVPNDFFAPHLTLVFVLVTLGPLSRLLVLELSACLFLNVVHIDD